MAWLLFLHVLRAFRAPYLHLFARRRPVCPIRSQRGTIFRRELAEGAREWTELHREGEGRLDASNDMGTGGAGDMDSSEGRQADRVDPRDWVGVLWRRPCRRLFGVCESNVSRPPRKPIGMSDDCCIPQGKTVVRKLVEGKSG
jgi:hypothetical protein